MNRIALVSAITLLLLTGCGTSTSIDEFRVSTKELELKGNEQIVVMGRRHSGEYETEPGFIDCIGDKLANNGLIKVMPEQEFLDGFYPWFEPRTAPLGLKRMGAALNDPLIGNRIRQLGIRYMIWVDGKTETSEKTGAMSCALSPAGGGCFGFTSWDKYSNYEAIIWDLKQLDEKGRVTVDSKGSSYVFAVGAPIPLIAQVQSGACEGIGKRLQGFFITQNTGP
ncbi:hypothetical protein [Porticoccus sp.]